MVTDKRVLLLISSLGGGGAEGVCVNVANGLANQGWQVELVVLHLKNVAYLERVSNLVNLNVLSVGHARYAVFPLAKLFFRNNISTILVFDFELTVIAVALKTIFKFKLRIVSRNINTLSQIRKNNQSFFQRIFLYPIFDYFFGRVDHVINQCHAMRKDLISIYPKLASKSSVIYNPVTKYIEDFAKNNDLEKFKKEDYLLCVGRLEKQKAFHFAIAGFAGIHKEYDNLRLKIVGNGSLESKLKQVAKDYGVFEKVDFIRFQKDMIPFYLSARATVLTSLYEGFPNVLVESITLNTPVVSFDCLSGPSEIIKDNVNGFLVKYQNIEDLEIKLQAVLNSKFNKNLMNESVNSNKISEVLKLYSKQLLSI